MSKGKRAFPFLSKIGHAIVESIRLAIEDVMPEIMQEHNLVERNGHGQFRWNPIISCLRDKCDQIGWFSLGTCKRGGWRVPVLFHPASNYILTLMTESNLKVVQKNKDKGQHYLCAASAKNMDTTAKEEQLKLDLPPIGKDASRWIAETQEQLAECVRTTVGNIEGHILIVFDTSGDNLSSVRAVRLTPSLEESTEEEDWSQYIRMPYSSYEVVEPRNLQNEDDGEVLVELKAQGNEK